MFITSSQQTLSMSTDQQLQEVQSCKKRRCSDTDSDIYADEKLSWTQRLELSDYMPGQVKNLTFDDMQWLAYSHYGKETGLNKFYDQFRNITHMIHELYDIPNYVTRKTFLPDHSEKYIKNWLFKNNSDKSGLFKKNPEFDEIKLAEIHLNKMIEDNELELVNLGVKPHFNRKDRDRLVSRYADPRDILRDEMSMVYDHKLWGYFRAADSNRRKIYIIARSEDPAPSKYESMYILSDVYQQFKDHSLSFPKISTVASYDEEIIAYNSRLVIYKISV